MLRRLTIALVWILILPVVLVAATFAVAQTQVAKDQISGMVENRLRAPGREAEIQGLAGLLPFDVRIGTVRLSDDEGVWLEADRARIRTSPSDLLRGRIIVEEIGLERLALNRLPPPGPETAESEPEETETTGLGLPELPFLPESLPVFRAERIHVDRIELGEPVIGEAAVFNLEGRAGTNDQGTDVGLELELKRTDAATASLTLKAFADLEAQTVRLDLQGSEAGGLVRSLSGQATAGAMKLSLTGEGPLDSFNARLDAEVEGLAAVNADIGIGIGRPPKLVLVGGLKTEEGLLPADLVSLIGRDITFDIDAQEQTPGLFAVQSFDVRAGAIGLTGAGTADINANSIDIALELGLDDLSRASEIAGTPLAGKAGLNASLKGALDQPDFVIDLTGDGLAVDQFSLSELALSVQGRPTASLNDGYKGADLQATGVLTGLMMAGEPLRPTDRIDLNLSARIPVEGEISLDTFRIEGGPVEADATATVDAVTFAGNANAAIEVASLEDLITALGPIAPPDLTLKGSAALTADATIGEDARQINALVNLKTDALDGLPSGVGAVTGPNPSLSAQIDFALDGAVQIKELLLDAAALAVTGNVALDQPTGAVNGDLKLSVPSLQPLEELAGQPLEGSVDLDIKLGGVLDAPEAALALLVSDLAAAGQRFDAITLDANAGGAIETLSGSMSLNTVKFGENLGISTDFARNNAVVDLSNFAVQGPSTDIKGDVSLDTETLLASGSLKGGIDNLAQLEPWIGQVIEGAVALDAAFSAASGGQDIKATIDADQISGSFGALQSARLQADITDLLGAVALQADLDASGFSQPGLTIDEAAVRLGGTLDDLRLQASVEGDQNGPLTAKAEARASLDGTLATIGPESLRSLFLDKLEAEMQGQTFELLKPTAITLDDGVLDLDQLDLKIGTGTIKGKASLGETRVFADLALDSFELATVESFGGPALSGDVTGKIGLDGTRSSPDLQMTLDLVDFALTDADHVIQTADISAVLRVFDGDASSTVEVKGLGNEPLNLRAQFPFAFSFDPFLAEPDIDLLEATLRGQLELGKTAEFATYLDQRFEGIVETDLQFSGPLDRPDLRGSIAMEDGLIEGGITGILLQDVTIDIEARGQSIEIVTFKASDDSQGSLNISGNVSLVEANAFDIKLTTSDLHLLRNDLGNAWIDMTIDTKGDLTAASVEGKVKAREVDIAIPSRFSSSIEAIDVTEINSPDGNGGNGDEFETPMEVRLAIDIDVPAKLFVRGRGLDTEWGGTLRVSGTANDPIMTGKISYVRGFLDFLAQRFTIDQGVIDFNGTVPPDPKLFFQARSEGEEITALVVVTGSVSDPELTLTSQPPRPQDEVLAQLLFGRDISQITPGQGLRIAAAANELAGGPGINPLGALREGFGLDTLDISNDEEDVNQSTARAGKYLTDRVYFEVERGVTPQSGVARVEVELSQLLSATTEFTEHAQSGVGLEWRWDY